MEKSIDFEAHFEFVSSPEKITALFGLINDPQWLSKMEKIKEKAQEIAGPMLDEMNASKLEEGDAGIAYQIGTIYSIKEPDFKPKDFTLSIK